MKRDNAEISLSLSRASDPRSQLLPYPWREWRREWRPPSFLGVEWHEGHKGHDGYNVRLNTKKSYSQRSVERDEVK